jgi:hypothetical protein
MAGHPTTPAGAFRTTNAIGENMGRGIISVVIGLVMIVGGLTGNMALRGTNSGGALAVVGGIVAAIGVVRILSSRA